MTISNLSKSVALLGGVGSSIGGYFLISNLSSDNSNKKRTSISDRLKNEGYTLLDFSNTTGSDWEKIKAAYKSEGAGVRRFSETKKTDDDSLISEIKDFCPKYLRGDSSHESNYQMSRRWCVVPISIKDKLKSKTFLNTDTSSDDGTWAEMVKKNGVSDFLTSVEGQNDETKKTEIKKQCKEKAQLETTSVNFDEILKKVELWCTKDTPPSTSQTQ
ncbi:hypothetical protein MHC_01740 [Mycoplasma haemocanis str. Illinois]|uniref:Uncharacterized protein n=1 Tax=Mycoplasma haemocanis (strain Illinois) TaxID=1111676 RepID=H6N6E2_MYCHN|nr:hypothetical protein [Mycoplasma haemocanis]AEW45214.1 hypothetical protein MHC_01740 [Mycoplasma haemocanis str. Illinois]